MNHSEVVKLLPWYVNSTLTEQERGQIQEHVDQCKTCQTEVQQLTILQEAVRETSAQEIVPSDDLFERLMKRVDDEESETGFQRIRGILQDWIQGQVLIPVAAGVLLLIVSYQSLVVIPGLESQVHRLSQVQSTLSVVLPPAVRGTASEIIADPEDQFLHLIMDINTSENWNALLCRFISADGQVVLEQSVEFTPNTLNLLVPVSKLAGGEYTLIISGQNGDGSAQSEVSRYRFNLSKN